MSAAVVTLNTQNVVRTLDPQFGSPKWNDGLPWWAWVAVIIFVALFIGTVASHGGSL